MTKSEEEKSEENEELDFSKDDDPEAGYRMYSIISYFLVLVVIGLPVWWFTTRVYRAQLPLDRMFDIELPNKIHKEHKLPLSLEYDILISIVNPDPTNLKLNLNPKKLDWHLQPFLETVAPVANFTVKSQWLYLVELGAVPRKIQDHFALYEEQLPHVITPLEKKLWSHLSPRPCINLVLYLSHCRVPLYIYDKNNQKLATNSFVSPGWGGIYIINADPSACTKKQYTPELQPIISTFVTQLERLLGVNISTKDELIAFQRNKAIEMVDSAKRTLKSLAQLLLEISSIVISDEVASKIVFSVQNVDEAEKLLKTGGVEDGLRKAKIAYANAEEAFSDPSLLALLYFPDDQKYAVYIPLFLPVMIPVLMSLTTFKKIRNRSKLKKD